MFSRFALKKKMVEAEIDLTRVKDFIFRCTIFLPISTQLANCAMYSRCICRCLIQNNVIEYSYFKSRWFSVGKYLFLSRFGCCRLMYCNKC